ncbi:MAG: medium chain dehydrogenase/reductase family protein [Candidatus Binataceae bacterium]
MSATPKLSRQIVITKRGGPEVLKLREVPLPECGPKQVRIRVTAAGVVFADLLMREGLYPDIPPFPFVPGVEAAGIVDAKGDDVTGFEAGERVAALCGFGGYTEFLVVDSWRAIKIPEGVSDIDAAALVVNYLTGYQMLYRVAHSQPGQTILVHGAAGGVGTALLDLAVWMKLNVWGTASKQKHDLVRKYGAHPIDYQNEDFVEVLRREVKHGVDAVFDPIGGSYWRRSMQALSQGGLLVGYGFSAATSRGRWRPLKTAVELLRNPRPSPLGLMPINKGIFGYSAQNLCKVRTDWYHEDLATLLKLCSQGILRPLVDRCLPLEDAAGSHRLLGNSQILGKIVLTI